VGRWATLRLVLIPFAALLQPRTVDHLPGLIPGHSLRHICCYGLTTFSLSILVHTTSHALGELVGYMCRY